MVALQQMHNQSKLFIQGFAISDIINSSKVGGDYITCGCFKKGQQLDFRVSVTWNILSSVQTTLIFKSNNVNLWEMAKAALHKQTQLSVFPLNTNM